MRRTNLYASTALGLCLVAHPGLSLAEMPAVSDDELGLFSPLVQPCIENPSLTTCAESFMILPDCADDLDLARCEVLLEDADAVLEDPEQRARVMEILGDVQVELRAQAETGLVDPDTSPTLRDRLGALLGEEQVTPEPAPEEVVPEPAPEEIEPELPEIVSDGPTDEELAAMQQELARQEAAEAEAASGREALPQIEPEAPTSDASDPVAQTEADPNQRALRQEARRIAQEERARLLAEADAMAEDAPELVVEDAPAEEFVAPVEEVREPTTQERANINRLLDMPEVAAALGLLGAAVEVAPTGADEVSSDDRRPAAARAARAERGEADTSPDSGDETAEVIEQAITADQLRSSREDFDSRLSMDFEAAATGQGTSRDNRDLERAGLAALGALAVGMIINQNRVVARSDERVVVDQGDGTLELWRDDDAILLQDGSTRRIERYSDGSTRTRWERLDGTQVITIRDATGRILRRDRLLADGTYIELIDDTRDISPIIVSELPPLRLRELRISQRTDPELALVMLREAEADARAVERSFSLRQIRETRELRELLPLLSPDPITFETNRANVRADEASKLLQVGRLMERLIAINPREVFLIEGHTDATGPAAFNLALSDRRAESVALALTEYFAIPPENLVVQGYGKRYLRVATLAPEERNRRVAIRRITPLLEF